MNYQKPRGTQDILPSESKKWQYLENEIRKITNLYGFGEIRTPIFEHTEVFKRENDSSDVVNKEMYTFTMNKTSLTLRPEQTASVVRSYVENKLYGVSELPLKLFYIGPQFRHERPQKGRLRQFHQFGTEILGARNPFLDVECIALGYTLLQKLGLKSLKVLLNTLGDKESREAYRDALQKHFSPVIHEYCEDCKRRLDQNPLRILDCKVDKEHPYTKNAPQIEDYLNEESKNYFEQVKQGLETLNIPYEIDSRLVRGLDYYCDTVFEVVSTSEALGSQSTIFGGGRYEKLAEYYGGPETPAVGFGMGLERVLLALELENPSLITEEGIDAYVMCLSKDLQHKAFKIVQDLRAAGFRVQGDYFSRSLKAQFKSVDKTSAKFAIILGNKEDENQSVNIKEIATQNQDSVKYSEINNYMKLKLGGN